MGTEFHQLTIRSVEQLCQGAVAIHFTVPEALREVYQYTQGQHLTLRTFINGEDIRRSYSICNSVKSQDLTVAVKQIEGGVFSGYANEVLKPGMTLDVMPPQGHFYTELDSSNQKNYLFIAVGSGITPNLSHIQSILESEPESMVTLIYGNRATASMMFRNKIGFIKNAYLSRFQWINFFSQEESEIQLFNGRISGDKLLALNEKKLINTAAFDEFFICGPEAMINDVVEYLKKEDIDSPRIHFELFYVDSETGVKQGKSRIREKSYGDSISDVFVKYSGRRTKVELAFAGGTILDAVMDSGIDLPFSCKGGVCATCKAKVVYGEVEMDSNYSLTEQEVSEGMVLTCQAHPLSKRVDIDFDFT